MSYEKQTFVDRVVDASGNVITEGTKLKAEHLKHIEDGIVKSISYDEQNLTEEQKKQARENIGAGVSDRPLGDFKRTPVYNCLNIHLDGDTTAMTKENAVMLDILILDEYGNVKFDGKSKTAWQGSASLSYPNKNLSLKLRDKVDTDSKVELSVFPEYATSTYHLKCNYADYSMVRNSVGAKMAKGFDDTVFPVDAPMVVNSVPAILYLNGEFNGCYTLNTKQDDLLFGMATEANPLTQIVYRSGLGSWEMSNFEYRSDGTETAEIKAKLQRLMDFCQNADDATFVAEFENYLSLRNAINYWIFADVACASDNMINNWTIATWDGAKWYMLWYDLDIIFGLFRNDGISYHPSQPTSDLLNLQYTVANPIWAKLYRNFFEDIKERYWELRHSGALTPTAIVNKFRTFQSKWGDKLIEKEREKWTGRPNTTDDIDMMYGWIAERLDYLDGRYSDHTLPSGYTRLSYIEGTGTQYINTEQILFASDANFDTEDDGFLLDFSPLENTDDSVAKMIFGATDHSGTYDLQAYVIDRWLVMPFTQDASGFSLTSGLRYNLQIGLNTLYDDARKNNVWVTEIAEDGTEIVKTKGLGLRCTGAGIMYLMAQNARSSGFDATSIAPMRLFECWYKQNGVYVMYLVPALDPDGKPCMFDLVAQKPHYNAGTGEFIYAE